MESNFSSAINSKLNHTLHARNSQRTSTYIPTKSANNHVAPNVKSVTSSDLLAKYNNTTNRKKVFKEFPRPTRDLKADSPLSDTELHMETSLLNGDVKIYVDQKI